MPRALPALPVEDAQRQQLQQWIAAFGTPRQVALRSQIVLAAAEGEANNAIAQGLQVSRPMVSLWRARFVQGGPPSLWKIAAGRGRKAIYGPGKIQAIVDATLQSKPKGMTQWSCRLMAEAQGVSKSTISNIWRSHKLELHRVKRFKSSRDPKFLKKITDVVPVEATIAKRIEEFLRRLVAHGNYYEELFDKLCKEGCSSECLAGLLFGVCVIAVGESTGLIDLQEPSISEVRRCARDLRTLADRVGRFNNPRMNPKFDLSTATPSPDLDPGRKHVAHLYDVLPGLMKMYSFHLERFSEFSRSIFKRRRFMHFETLRLLLYVKESTDRPHYEDLSTLLNAGFLAIKGKEADIPRFFSSEGLAKLSQRTTNFGLTSRF